MVPDFTQKRFGFLMYDEFEELDLIGPWEMATMWAAYAKGPQCITFSEQGGTMRCAKGLAVSADESFATIGKLDYLLVPGGFAAMREAENEAMLAYLKRAADEADTILSVCTGSIMLLAAGLLDGRSATTHWKAIPALRDAGVHVDERRYVADGPVWTSGGVSAGIDMTLAFIAATAGEEAASIVQHNAEYYPDPNVYGTVGNQPTSPAYVRRLFDSEATAA